MNEKVILEGAKKIVRGWSLTGLKNVVRQYDEESLTIVIRALGSLIAEGERVGDFKAMLDVVYDAQMELRAKRNGVEFKSPLLSN